MKSPVHKRARLPLIFPHTMAEQMREEVGGPAKSMKLVKNGTSKTKHLDHCAAILVHVHVMSEHVTTRETLEQTDPALLNSRSLVAMDGVGWTLQCQA